MKLSPVIYQSKEKGKKTFKTRLEIGNDNEVENCNLYTYGEPRQELKRKLRQK